MISKLPEFIHRYHIISYDYYVHSGDLSILIIGWLARTIVNARHLTF